MIGRVRSYLAGETIGLSLLRTVSGSAGVRVAGMGFGFLVGVQLARGLGPAGYGLYGTAMAIVSVLMIPTELGLPQLVTREIAAGDSARAPSILSWAKKRVAISSLFIALAMAALILVGVPGIDLQLRNALLIGTLWIPVVAMGNIYGAALRGLHRVVAGQLGEFLLRPVLMSVFLLAASLLLTGGLTPSWAMALNVTAAAIVALLGYFWLRTSFTGLPTANYPESVPATLSFGASLPIALSEGMRVLASQIGVLVLAWMVSDSEVGQYRVAAQIYAVSTMPSALANIACAPMIAAMNAQGRRRDIGQINVWISVFLLAGALLAFLMFLIFGDYAIAAAFGNGYAPALQLLLAFLLGEVFVSLFGYPTVVLNMMHHQRVVVWWAVVGLLSNVALSLLFVPLYGGLGAVIGTSFGLLVWRAGCAVYAKRKLNVDTSVLMRCACRISDV